MSQTPFEQASSLVIGTVEYVSPDEIKIAIDIEAPDSMALNTGGPRPFPRVNEYLLIPVDQGFIVGQVEWITIERSPFPKRKGMQDFGLIDLPYPLRRLNLNPLGTLRPLHSGKNFEFTRGCEVLPSVGTPAILPTDEQLKAIVESGAKKRVCIGISPVANNAKVYVDPDRLFGRHLAVLGNTGSGKSCTVAGLIRWCIESAAQETVQKSLNTRFIILDPNGEYSKAFSNKDDKIKTRIFKVNPAKGEFPLKVPLWFWNSSEWCAFTQASAKTQRPLLRRALREVKAGRDITAASSDEEKQRGLRRYLSSQLISINNDIRSNAIKTDATKFGFRLRAISMDLQTKMSEFPNYEIDEINTAITSALNSAYNSFEKDGKIIEYYQAFTESQVKEIVIKLNNSGALLGGIIFEGPDEDVPLQFKGVELADHLEILGQQENQSQFIDLLVARIRTLIADPRIKSIIEDTENITVENWLKDYIGSDNSNYLSIIDLSLVPTDVVHTVTAVIARMIFEALQRYVKLNHVALPTVLVMEEAHTFIKHYKEDSENQDAAAVCCQVFEKIAREGRKFGLGLVLSSQRPSELSPTVLSQCNTFLLHRISNDRDQELVHRFVPDNLRGLLRELPSLPSQHAILLGWASELPVLVKINDLPKSQQPRSDDPDFWNVWIGKDEEGKVVERKINWKTIADDWQQKTSSDTNEEKEENEKNE